MLVNKYSKTLVGTGVANSPVNTRVTIKRQSEMTGAFSYIQSLNYREISI